MKTKFKLIIKICGILVLLGFLSAFEFAGRQPEHPGNLPPVPIRPIPQDFIPLEFTPNPHLQSIKAEVFGYDSGDMDGFSR